MKIIAYKVAQELEVKHLLKEGWEPYFGPTLREFNLTFYQAMVKWSKE